MRKSNLSYKTISLCEPQGCCPRVEIRKGEVRIGEKGNLCILKKTEWETLKRKIRENKI